MRFNLTNQLMKTSVILKRQLCLLRSGFKRAIEELCDHGWYHLSLEHAANCVFEIHAYHKPQNHKLQKYRSWYLK